jgi:branched-chain amino acid transport system substrate-binding protein
MSASSPGTREPWRIGVLFSRTGLTAVSETEHFFGTALAIQRINERGGILGRGIEVVAYDPASDPITYRQMADRLLTEDGVSVIFGCSTSAERKAVLPVIERRNGLLFYPSLYEGFEYSPNVVYTGAAPNQNSFPLAEYLIRHIGRRIFLIGSDYVYPHETNRIMRDLIEAYDGSVAGEIYVPMDASDALLRDVLEKARDASPEALFSTVVGRTAQRFYRLYREIGLDPARMPIASLTMAEGEVRAIGTELCAGHVTAATYFGSIDTLANRSFVAEFRAAYGDTHPTSMWSAGAYAQVLLFARALERTASLDTQRLLEATLGLPVDAPEGTIQIDPDNNHAWLTARIGRLRADGSFELLWQAPGPIRPDPYLAATPLGGRWLAAPEPSK